MIARLEGVVADVEASFAIIDVNGVGYEVALPESVFVQLPLPGEPVTLYIRAIYREDDASLYGFLNLFQRRMFDLLMTVKGCGPKVAMALLGLGEDAVAVAIESGDSRTLSRASGVGPRLAERLILELKDKIKEENFGRRVAAAVGGRQHAGRASDELVGALLALGYRRQEAEVAAEQARGEADSVEEQLKIALRGLAR
ncbi:MAG TPA: Holliday junction branch migration protein RuvA [Fimbriimonadaceae bacterium]|nr:Holliday junction branch migration protein RuvA [Fimbriimonadaceae bacterium]